MKILLADDDADRARALARQLGADPMLAVLRLPRGASLPDAVAAHAPDLVIVDMARPDRDALEGLRALSASAPRPVVLFVDEDDPGFMEDAIAAGVSSYNVLGLPPPDVKPILRAAVALFRRHQGAAAALAETELRLADREAIDKAKAALIHDRKFTEPQAHRFLQRQAMAGRERMAAVARRLLDARACGRREEP